MDKGKLRALHILNDQYREPHTTPHESKVGYFCLFFNQVPVMFDFNPRAELKWEEATEGSRDVEERCGEMLIRTLMPVFLSLISL